MSPTLGRNFLPEEDRPNGPRVVMISYGLWKGHYYEDLHIVGSMINIDGSPARVVRVLPKEFQFPTLEPADIVFPMALNPARQQKINGGFGNPMRVFARLKPGDSVTQAYAQMQPLVDSEKSSDVVILSHEMAETFNDPFLAFDGVHGITPWWLAPNGQCQDLLEGGDAIENLPDSLYPITLNGFTYQTQNIMLLPWFAFQSPSQAIDHAYSYPNTNVVNALSPPLLMPGCQ